MRKDGIYEVCSNGRLYKAEIKDGLRNGIYEIRDEKGNL